MKTGKFVNQKIKNAEKKTVDGIQYDSRLEAYMGGKLRQFKIPFEFQKLFILQPKFKYQGKIVRPIEMIVDFCVPEYNLLIDTKGWETKDSKIKFKLLKYKFVNTPFYLEMPSTQKQCDEVIRKIMDSQYLKNVPKIIY